MTVTSRNSLLNLWLVCQVVAQTGLQLQDNGAPGPPCWHATKMALLTDGAPHRVSSAPPCLTTWLNGRADWGPGRGDHSQTRIPQICAVSTQCSVFSWINDSQFGACLWLISRALKWLLLTVLSDLLLSFCEEDVLTSSLHHAGNKCPFL